MPEDESMKGEYTGVLIFIVIAVVFYIIWPYLGGPEAYAVKGPIMWIAIAAMILLAGQYLIWHSRYQEDQFICDGLHGSVSDPPTQIGTWAVFKLGEADDPVHWPAIKVCVVPWCNVYRIGHCWLAATKVRKTPYYFTPAMVARELFRHRDRYPVDNCYFGRFDNQFILEHKNENIQELIEMLDNAQAGEAMRDRHIEGDDELITEKMHLNKELNGAPSPIERIFGPRKPAEPTG